MISFFYISLLQYFIRIENIGNIQNSYIYYSFYIILLINISTILLRFREIYFMKNFEILYLSPKMYNVQE